MKYLALALVLAGLSPGRIPPTTAIAGRSPETGARAIVSAALAEMGGEDKLRSIKSVAIEGVGQVVLRKFSSYTRRWAFTTLKAATNCGQNSFCNTTVLAPFRGHSEERG